MLAKGCNFPCGIDFLQCRGYVALKLQKGTL